MDRYFYHFVLVMGSTIETNQYIYRFVSVLGSMTETNRYNTFLFRSYQKSMAHFSSIGLYRFNFCRYIGQTDLSHNPATNPF